MEPLKIDYDAILEDLADKGWTIHRDWLPKNLVEALSAECKLLWQDDQFHLARVGVGADKVLRPEIRTDRVRWLDEADLSPATTSYWRVIEELRVQINQAFFLGLRDFEGHFAIYPPGSFYKRHLDQFKSSGRRRISCILYLNETWRTEDGGQLRLYLDPEDDAAYLDVMPERGTFVCFRSDTVYHEVLPSQRDRMSLTGWLRGV